MQLSVIIVNYNVKYFLEQCLHSVMRACIGIDAEIFVVDNNSSDGSRQWLGPRFPAVKFEWNPENAGFAKANNAVLAAAKGDYVLFLNPDTIVAEDALKKCLDFFSQTPQCGAVGVRMVDGSGTFLKESRRSFPSPAFSFFKLSGLASLFPASKRFAGYYAGHLPNEKNHNVEALSGAFMMLSRRAVNATSGFDEDFFMYGEDIDLSYRIRQAGLENWYFAGTTIMHFKGESTQKLSASYTDHFYGAMKLFVQKHYHGRKGGLLLSTVAIPVAKTIGKVKQRFTASADAAGPPESIQTAIIAGQQRFDELLQLIKYAAVPLAISGRISTDPADKKFCIGHVSEVVALARKNNIQQLIFCEGEMSFKEIIQQVTNPALVANCLFTAAGSDSIVGSTDKNAKGFFIANPLAS